MKKHMLYIGAVSLIMLFALSACGSDIINDSSDLFDNNIFVGTGEMVGYDGDELAWYSDIWGFGAAGISLHFIDRTVGIDAFIDWKHQFAGHGPLGWRNGREANFVTFIYDFDITTQDLINAQEDLYGKQMDEIEALIQWARYGVHTNAQERADASFWAWSLSLSDIEALVSNNVTTIWAAFPGHGIYQDGRAYTPEWIFNNMEYAVIQERLPPDEIIRILQHARDYKCLDDIRNEAEIAFHAALASLPLIV